MHRECSVARRLWQSGRTHTCIIRIAARPLHARHKSTSFRAQKFLSFLARPAVSSQLARRPHTYRPTFSRQLSPLPPTASRRRRRRRCLCCSPHPRRRPLRFAILLFAFSNRPSRPSPFLSLPPILPHLFSHIYLATHRFVALFPVYSRSRRKFTSHPSLNPYCNAHTISFSRPKTPHPRCHACSRHSSLGRCGTQTAQL